MGIPGIYKNLPKKNYNNITDLNLSTRVYLDVANPMVSFADHTKNAYLEGNYVPALRLFNDFIIRITKQCAHLTVVFDGGAYIPKEDEEIRRTISGGVRNTPRYIAGAVKLCRINSIEFIVSYSEADFQLSLTPEFAKSRTVISHDMDMFALGVRRLIYVERWDTFKCTYIDLDDIINNGMKEISSSNNNSNNDNDSMVGKLVDILIKHKNQLTLVFQLIAAAVGCDFSSNSNGLDNIGIKKAIKFIMDIDEGCLSIQLFADKVALVNKSDNAFVVREINKVVNGYLGGHYYDLNGNVIPISSTSEIVTEVFTSHMKGECNSKTRCEFDEATIQFLKDLDYLLFDSSHVQVSRNVIGETLPADPKLSDLRNFIGARGGTTSRINKAECLGLASHYMALEKQVSIPLHERVKYTGLKVPPAQSGLPVLTVLKNVLSETQVVKNIAKDTLELLNLVYKNLEAGDFSDDSEDIARHAPELKQQIIDDFFKRGNAELASQLRVKAFKLSEDTQSICHINIQVEHAVLVVSLQSASLRTDKQQPQEYLTIVEMRTMECAEHGRGKVIGSVRVYCTCTAGSHICHHMGASLYDQIKHTHPGDDIVPTDVPKEWDKLSSKANIGNNASKPIQFLTARRPDQTNPFKKFRSCRSHIVFEYTSLSEEDLQLAMTPMNSELLRPLCEEIMKDGAVEHEETEDEEDDEEEI